MMQDDAAYITQSLQKLVQINSVNPSLETNGAGELEIGQWIAGELSCLGIDNQIDEFAKGRVNVVGRLPGAGSGKSLIINAHMDTVGVSGMKNPFQARIEDGKLYGRGSYDMKGSIAAMLNAARKLKSEQEKLNGDLILAFVADEEYESIGTIEFLQNHHADAAIVTEPTGLDICIAHRGFAVFKITTSGKTAHGGKHREGIDANRKMGKLLAELDGYASYLPQQKKHPLCGEASMHIPLMQGGKSLFIYANECVIHLERRTLPGDTKQTVMAELQEMIQKIALSDPAFNASIDCILWRDPYEIDKEKAIVAEVQKAAKAACERPPVFMGHTWWEDAALFGKAGIETVIIGPKGGGIHEETEWVEIDSLVQLSRILSQTARQFCA